jgi:hypothetical protein
MGILLEGNQSVPPNFKFETSQTPHRRAFHRRIEQLPGYASKLIRIEAHQIHYSICVVGEAALGTRT